MINILTAEENGAKFTLYDNGDNLDFVINERATIRVPKETLLGFLLQPAPKTFNQIMAEAEAKRYPNFKDPRKIEDEPHGTD